MLHVAGRETQRLQGNPGLAKGVLHSDAHQL